MHGCGCTADALHPDVLDTRDGVIDVVGRDEHVGALSVFVSADAGVVAGSILHAFSPPPPHAATTSSAAAMTPRAFLISSSFAADVDEHLPDGADEQPKPTLPDGLAGAIGRVRRVFGFVAPRIGGVVSIIVSASRPRRRCSPFGASPS